MYDKTMTFSVNDEKEIEMKKTLTAVYDALVQKRIQSSESDCRLYSVRGSDLHNHLRQCSEFDSSH